MFFVVKLKKSKNKILIPSKWIKDLKVVELLNYGIQYQKKKVCTIFYSNNFDAEPDFKMPIIDVFDAKSSGCYEGSILKYFSK